ncbi:MAG: 5-(carboxyamino)imidazole ribonucleotide mutase [Pseudomonadales bacterium]|nr:5-(carboxyamino)imidazole ribonucleotide mutase [Pseudomonadales bacterium]
MSKPFVAILIGSDADLPQMEPALDTLARFKLDYELKVTSALRAPDSTRDYVKDAEKRGCQVFICAAGLAAHLAPAVAAVTTRPVIGNPLEAALDGLDALLSTVQMPGGIPVATVAIGRAGAKNAAYLAAQIMALLDPELAQRLKDDRAANVKALQEKDAALQARLARQD